MAQPEHVPSEIRWREWGDGAFREASDRNVPILLDISAVWCHWCHVMDRTTYDDPEVARAIKESFVPVKVDNDRRPDINRRYNMGGWPTTAFLTPSGQILTGGTYFPPETMRGILRQVSSAWAERKDELQEKIAQLSQRQMAAPQSKGKLTSSIVERVLGGIAARYDRRFGGFGPEPKFPHAHALELLLNRHVATGEDQLKEMVFHTLDGMASGGMYDHVEGGFFRYSTTGDWSVPHFEKMSEDNARLLRVLLIAGSVEGGERFHAAAADVFRYVRASLTDPEGGFYGSQDADEEYYALDEAGRRDRQPPFVDRTLYADWNGLMARAHLLGGRLLRDPTLRHAGLRALDRMLSLLGPGRDGLAHHFEGSRSDAGGFLGDHAELGLACLDASMETGERTYLDSAHELAAFAIDHLGANGGAFLDRPEGSAEGALAIPVRPLEENAAMASLLTRLGRVLRDESLLARAEDVLGSFAVGYDLYDLMGGPFALAVDEFLAEPVHVTVVGDAGPAAALREAAFAGYRPYKLVDTLDPDRDEDLLERAQYRATDQPIAYVCIGAVCYAPTADPAEVDRLADAPPRRSAP